MLALGDLQVGGGEERCAPTPAVGPPDVDAPDAKQRGDGHGAERYALARAGPAVGATSTGTVATNAVGPARLTGGLRPPTHTARPRALRMGIGAGVTAMPKVAGARSTRRFGVVVATSTGMPSPHRVARTASVSQARTATW